MDTSAAEVMASMAHSPDWTTWVTAVATVVLSLLTFLYVLLTFLYVLLTFLYVLLTRKILEAQSDPCVIVSIIHDAERATIFQLVVRNVGKGLAHDISFDLSRPIPSHAWGIAENEAKVAEKMTGGPLIDGIPALGPGEERKLDWGQYGGLLKNLGTEPVTVKCRFKKNGKSMLPVECKLDIKSFKDTIAAEMPNAKAARELENIATDFHQLVTGFHKLKIEMTETQQTLPGGSEENKT